MKKNSKLNEFLEGIKDYQFYNEGCNFEIDKIKDETLKSIVIDLNYGFELAIRQLFNDKRIRPEETLKSAYNHLIGHIIRVDFIISEYEKEF